MPSNWKNPPLKLKINPLKLIQIRKGLEELFFIFFKKK